MFSSKFPAKGDRDVVREGVRSGALNDPQGVFDENSPVGQAKEEKNCALTFADGVRLLNEFLGLTQGSNKSARKGFSPDHIVVLKGDVLHYLPLDSVISEAQLNEFLTNLEKYNSSSGVCVVCPSSAQRACAVVLEIAGLFCPGDVDCQPYSRGAVGGSVGVVGTTSPLCLRGFSGLAIFLGCRGARAGAAKVKITTKSPEHEFDHWLSSSSTSLIVLLGARQEEPDKDVWRRLKSIQSGLEQTAATECINMLLREHFRAKNSRRA